MTFTAHSQKNKKDSEEEPSAELEHPRDAEVGDKEEGGAKKAKTKPKAARATSDKKADGERVVKKRGPPRPHKRLAQEILDVRLGKLRNRIEKAKSQLEDAERHIDSYEKESKYRKLDAENPDAKL